MWVRQVVTPNRGGQPLRSKQHDRNAGSFFIPQRISLSNSIVSVTLLSMGERISESVRTNACAALKWVNFMSYSIGMAPSTLIEAGIEVEVKVSGNKYPTLLNLLEERNDLVTNILHVFVRLSPKKAFSPYRVSTRR